MAAASGGSGGGSGDNSASDGGGSSGESAKTGRVGQAVENAGTTYKVTNATKASTIGDPQIGGAKADGMFVIVSLELTNNKDETKTFTDSSAKLVTSDGNSYETSDKTVLAFENDENLLLKDIQPDLTTRGKLAFDIPPSKVSGSSIVIEDIFGDGEVKIELDL